MAFMTEKTIESFIEEETRSLPMPDGTMRDFCLSRIYWVSVDYVAAFLAGLPHHVEVATEHAAFYRVDLDTALAYEATRLHRWSRDVLKVETPEPIGVCPLRLRRLARQARQE